MREIKFRGQNQDSKEWFIGSYQSEPCPNITFINSANELDVSEVDPETVGQFTGLKDKNGVDIYEGDILSVNKSALEFDFKHSKAGELMISRNIDELLIEVRMFEYLQISTTVYLKKDNSFVRDSDYWELTEEDYQSMKSEDIEKCKKPWCEKSTDIQFLRYCSKYAYILGNIHSNPELLNNNQNK